jgi:hypothetical protein
VQFRRPGFLSDLVGAAQTGAAIVSERVLPGGHYQDWRAPTHTMPRPAPWLFLADVPSLRSLGTSFVRVTEPSDEYPEGQVTYDVGAKLYQRALDTGLRHATLGPSFRRKYRHFGNASWGSRTPMPVGRIRHRPAATLMSDGLAEMRSIRTRPSRFHV